VYLEAGTFTGAQINAVPILRGSVSLSTSWPGVRNHPWTNFATDPPRLDNPKLDEALRRFRKFVISFRSHSKGALARYQHKIEHERMTKGMGQAVLDRMVQDEILSLRGNMYFLDPNQLAKVAGANYAETMARKFDEKTISYIRQAIEDKP